MFFRLRELKIPVACFADADKSKQGHVIDGVSCISYEELLKKDREDTVVLVCKQNPEDLINQFRKEGFSRTYHYKEVENLERIYPAIELNTETLERMNIFREALYQIFCQPQETVEWRDTPDAFGAALGEILRDAQNRRRR